MTIHAENKRLRKALAKIKYLDENDEWEAVEMLDKARRLANDALDPDGAIERRKTEQAAVCARNKLKKQLQREGSAGKNHRYDDGVGGLLVVRVTNKRVEREDCVDCKVLSSTRSTLLVGAGADVGSHVSINISSLKLVE